MRSGSSRSRRRAEVEPMHRFPVAVLIVALLAVSPPGPSSSHASDRTSVPRIGRPAGVSLPDGPPAGMRTVVVMLRSQADLSRVPLVGRRAALRGVVQELRATSAAGQVGILSFL